VRRDIFAERVVHVETEAANLGHVEGPVGVHDSRIGGPRLQLFNRTMKIDTESRKCKLFPILQNVKNIQQLLVQN
jgi:hypothetical protein